MRNIQSGSFTERFICRFAVIW